MPPVAARPGALQPVPLVWAPSCTCSWTEQDRPPNQWHVFTATLCRTPQQSAQLQAAKQLSDVYRINKCTPDICQFLLKLVEQHGSLAVAHGVCVPEPCGLPAADAQRRHRPAAHATDGLTGSDSHAVLCAAGACRLCGAGLGASCRPAAPCAAANHPGPPVCGLGAAAEVPGVALSGPRGSLGCCSWLCCCNTGSSGRCCSSGGTGRHSSGGRSSAASHGGSSGSTHSSWQHSSAVCRSGGQPAISSGACRSSWY